MKELTEEEIKLASNKSVTTLFKNAKLYGIDRLAIFNVVTNNDNFKAIPLKYEDKGKYLVYCLKDNIIKVINTNMDTFIGDTFINDDNIYDLIQKLNRHPQTFIIKSSDLSGKVFGFNNIKKSLVGKKLKGIIQIDNTKVLGTDILYCTIYDQLSGRNLKFCLNDIEIFLPDLKNYNFPKDKNLNIGKTVKYIKDKKEYIISSISKNKTSKRLFKNSVYNQLDVITLKDKVTGNSKKVYAKYLKVL